ncbi:MAG TPA: cytochrome P450 [Solirubrobacterales bacterium]|jgi:cytochrome P450|nr:cytochrome P450 [Solirubrobacterales bacterium]
MALPPGPSLPAPLQTLRLMVRPVALMERSRRQFGDTFTLRAIPVGEMVFISDPPSLKALFAADRINTIAAGRNIVLAPLLGEHSLLLLEGERHLGRRRLMLPPFHGERMRAYERAMEEATEREIGTWPLGAPFRLHSSMQSITLEVIMGAVFGVAERRRDELRQALLDILAATRSPASIGVTLPVVRELPRFRRLQREVEAADALLASEIAERRSDPDLDEREDILSLLISARDGDGEGMSDAELRDQLMTLLLAGHETTATALAWTFDLLFRRPEALARLTDEVRAGGDGDYLDAVIEEALRLRPVVPFVGRELNRPATLGGNDLPAGTSVFASIYLAHTDAATFPDPYAFRPERFLEEPPETYSWIPFGGGTRRCIGAAFAQLEMRVVLRSVLSRATLRPASAHPEQMVRRNVTLSPANGTPAVLETREPRRAPVTA